MFKDDRSRTTGRSRCLRNRQSKRREGSVIVLGGEQDNMSSEAPGDAGLTVAQRIPQHERHRNKDLENARQYGWTKACLSLPML